jgi:Domain of unknown function (DUF4253)
MPAMDDFFLSTYHGLLAAAARTGQCPVWIADLCRTDPPDDRERLLAELEARNPGQVLAEQWPGACPCCDEHQNPFRTGFPGLLLRPLVDLDDAIRHATRVIAMSCWSEPDLVPATRPADVPAVIGWTGSRNSWRDTVGMSAVLRSWEERFGALLLRVTSSTLEVAVASPPTTDDECLRVAAEHVAFCWHAEETYTGQMSTDTLRHYSQRLRDAPRWRFWWD